MGLIDLRKMVTENTFKLKNLPLLFWRRPTVAELITNALYKTARRGKLVIVFRDRAIAQRNAIDIAKALRLPLRHGNKITVNGIRVVFTWSKHDNLFGKSGPVIIDELHEPGIMEG